jgi:hypothetical protein
MLNSIQMLNQIETHYIHHFDKFISFLFGNRNENDPEQRIYNKLLQLEGEELDEWINQKIKGYITGGCHHYLDDFIGENFEEIKGRILFSAWYYSPINWHNGPENELIWLDDIYDRYEEEQLVVVKEKLFQHFQLTDRDYFGSWKMDLMVDYLEMYINTMTSVELKNYIKEIIDPYIPK